MEKKDTYRTGTHKDFEGVTERVFGRRGKIAKKPKPTYLIEVDKDDVMEIMRGGAFISQGEKFDIEIRRKR